jgi:ribosomal protein L37E
MYHNDTDCQALYTQISTLQEKLEAAYKRIKELAAWKRWALETLSISNKVASPAERIVAITAREELASQRNQPDRDAGRSTIYVPNIANRAGLSPQQTGDALRKLGQKGALDHEVYRPGTRFDTTRVAIAVKPQFIEHPLQAVQALPDEPERGGVRVRCVSCGSENVIEVRYHICADCGHEQPDSRRMKPLNVQPADDDAENAPAPVAPSNTRKIVTGVI